MGVTVVKRTRVSPEERRKRDRDRYQKMLTQLAGRALTLQTLIEATAKDLNQIKTERENVQRVLEALGGIEDDVEEEQGK